MSRDEAWKRAILTLPPGRFFNLMRNYLGDIRTPFDKHKLIRRLASFLRKKSVQERIIALLGEQEARLLTAVSYLGEPTLVALRTLLSDDLSLFELDDLVTNLEDRLCLFRMESADAPRIAITPQLAQPIAEAVIDSRLLFSGSPCDPRSGVFWLGDGVLLAILSFLAGRDWPLKKNGTMRKREEQQLRRVFPAGDPVPAFTGILPQVMKREGLVNAEWELDAAAWHVLASRPSSLRRFRLLALLGEGGRLDEAVLTGFLASLRERAYAPRDARRLWRLMCLRSTGTSQETPLPVDKLVLTGALIETDQGIVANADLVSSEISSERVRAVVQPNFEITLTRSATLEQALPIAQAAEIVRFDAALLFELTRDSFVRYLDQGGSVDRLLEAFEALGSADLPQNVLFSLRSWEKEYRRIALYRGVVLVTDEEHGYLLDHSPALSEYIRKKLAPGVYLLSADDEYRWREALRRAGVEHVPEIVSVEEDEKQPDLPFESVGDAPALPAVIPPVADREGPLVGSRADDGERIVDELLTRLASLKLSDEERAEIKTRVERKLVLLPDQLRPLRAGREKSEARGLDYLGKVRVIEHAIRESALVDIVERGPSGHPARLTMRPRELEKGGSALHVVGESLPGGAAVRINVSRISLVRRVYSSLLE